MAARCQPQAVTEAIDYHDLAENAEAYLEFARAWIQGANALDKPQIAAWLVNTSVADMSYLEAQAEAAVLLSNATRAALDYLSTLLEEATVLSSGPDAGLSKAGAETFTVAAQAIRDLRLP